MNPQSGFPTIPTPANLVELTIFIGLGFLFVFTVIGMWFSTRGGLKSLFERDDENEQERPERSDEDGRS